MRRSFSYGAATTQGHAATQEDGFYLDPSKGFFLLANGLGANSFGAKTAKEVLQHVAESFRSLAAGGITETSEKSIFTKEQSYLLDAVKKIHQKILAENHVKDWLERSATSLLTAWVDEYNRLQVLNCGSSGALLWRNQKFTPMVFPQLLDSMSSIPVPQQLLGFSSDLNPDVKELSLQAGDLVILYSDGLSQAVADLQEHFLMVFHELPREAGQSLMPLAQGCIQALAGSGLALQNASMVIFECPVSN